MSDPRIAAIRESLTTHIHGKPAAIDSVITCLIAGGHILIEDVPGVGKTTLAYALSRALHSKFNRIQFTSDLIPSDIIGVSIYQKPEARFVFHPGPIFANVVLADEINRSSPKSQSALLEAMQEHQVTAAGARHVLEEPFFVLATQNPVEMEGTYPLPEAQLDRFLFNVLIDYLSEEDETEVVRRTTINSNQVIEPVFSAEEVIAIQRLVREVPVSDDVIQYAVKLTAASRPNSETAPEFINKYVNWGAGTRAAQALVLAAKALALWEGRSYVSKEEIKSLAKPVFRHRILLNYRAEAEAKTVEHIIEELIESV